MGIRYQEPPTPPPSDKDVVFYTNEGFFDPERGEFLLAEIERDVAGYVVASRHPTLEAAKARAVVMNEAHGVDPDEVLTVVASSMRLGKIR